LLRKKDIINLPESEVIALAKKQSKYFGVLYDRYFDQLFRFVFKKVGGREDLAGDLTQQTFMKAMANISKYEDRGFPFSSWLYRIAQNEVLMYFRKSKKNIEVAIDENRMINLAGEANISNSMSVGNQERLIEMLNDLKENQLELIELRFFQSMSFKEISNIYNITEANAKMRIYRILERIEKKWEIGK
jgi:RNA polymerase sigma-70 factor (ECF subfamily)